MVTGARSAYADANPANDSALFTRITPNVDLDVTQDLGTDKVLAKPASVTSPIVGDFAGAQNLIKTAATRAGLSTGHAEYIGSPNGDVDGMSATATRKLWLRSRTPATSSTDEQAAFTVTVTAVTGLGL